MKLSEIKGERALEVMANLIDPISDLATDTGFRTALTEGKPQAVKYLLKNQAKPIIRILAILQEKDPETYEPSLLDLPVMLMEFFNDPIVADLFGLQSQITEKTSSGSVTENTEAAEA